MCWIKLFHKDGKRKLASSQGRKFSKRSEISSHNSEGEIAMVHQGYKARSELTYTSTYDWNQRIDWLINCFYSSKNARMVHQEGAPATGSRP
jgi:hypothetical protein